MHNNLAVRLLVLSLLRLYKNPQQNTLMNSMMVVLLKNRTIEAPNEYIQGEFYPFRRYVPLSQYSLRVRQGYVLHQHKNLLEDS